MFYYLYEIRNNINGKIYIGVHKTKNLNDDYMGSGKIIRDAITKYGINNFTKIIIEYFNNEIDMYNREKEIVTDEFLLREDVYNIRRGGTGGFDFINKNELNRASEHGTKGAIATNNKRKTDLEKDKLFKERSGNIFKKLHQEGKIKYDTFTGKKHSDLSKEKMSMAKKGKGVGQNNSQFGTMWITDGSISIKIKKNTEIPSGWKMGRSIR